MEMTDGKRFVWEKPEKIICHLEGVQRSIVPVATEDLRIKDDGRQLYLEIMGVGCSVHRVRKSFLAKLFALTHFSLPSTFGTSLSTETVVSIGNDLLLRIKADVVFITIEESEAFTLDLDEPNTHPSLQLLKALPIHDIDSVTHTDSFQRIRLKETYRAKFFYEHEFSFSTEIISSSAGIFPTRFYPYLKHLHLGHFALMKSEVECSDMSNMEEILKNEIIDWVAQTEHRFPEIERLILASSFEYIRNLASPPFPSVYKALRKSIKPHTINHASFSKSDLSFPMSFFDLFLAVSSAAQGEPSLKQLRTEKTAGMVIEYVALCSAHR